MFELKTNAVAKTLAAMRMGAEIHGLLLSEKVAKTLAAMRMGAPKKP